MQNNNAGLEQHSSYLGVAKDPATGSYLAFILEEDYLTIEKLGWFQDALSAGLYRDAALIKRYGLPSSAAFLNFPLFLPLLRDYAEAMKVGSSFNIESATASLSELADELRDQDAA